MLKQLDALIGFAVVVFMYSRRRAAREQTIVGTLSAREQRYRNIAANGSASWKFLERWLNRNNVLRKLVGEPETKTQIT
jgi:predicted transcriptional regulator